MNVSWGMHQTAQWSQKTSELDENAQYIYLPPQEIQARIVHHIKLVRAQDGREVASDTQVHVLESVAVGDQINGSDVISVRDGIGLYDASPCFYIAYL